MLVPSLVCAGTYAVSERGLLCLMCPTNFTTEADGSSECSTPVTPPPPFLARCARATSQEPADCVTT